MKERLFYPAVFQEEQEGGYTVTFPDLKGAVTYGESTEEAYEMAVEVMGLTLESLEAEKEFIPEPSPLKKIKTEENQFVAVIEFNFLEYKKKYDSKAVSKNCTIPNWMNVEAERAGINFSKLLQEAITRTLGIDRRKG